MPLAITTGGMIGLGAAAGLLILFALAASFWLPRRNPDFPGERLGSFIAVSLLLFVVVMAAVVVFAKEEEGHAEGGEAAETQPVTTDTGPGGEDGGEDGGEGGEGAAGDPAAGKEVFAAAGCGGCHTLADAGASGAIGPSLDDAQPDAEAVVAIVTNGRGAMPSFSDRLDETQIRDVAAYVADAAG